MLVRRHKIVARLDSPDMVSLSSTCKTMQSAVSAKWLWEAALGRDFPQRIPLKLEPHRSHPQHVYAAQFKHIVDATRRRTLGFFEPEKNWALIKYATAAVLDETLRCDGRMALRLAEIGTRFDYVEAYEQRLKAG